MKLSNLFWNLLGIMVLSACSNSDMTENDLSETNVDARFMSVDIKIGRASCRERV